MLIFLHLYEVAEYFLPLLVNSFKFCKCTLFALLIAVQQFTIELDLTEQKFGLFLLCALH